MGFRVQVNDNDDGDKVTNLINRRSIGQYRRQKRERNIHAQREKGLNGQDVKKKGGKSMKEMKYFHENYNYSPGSRSQHIFSLVEVFGFGSKTPKGFEIPDKIGRALGTAGYKVVIRPEEHGKISIQGTKKHPATSVLSYVHLYTLPYQETLAITRWGGADNESLHKALTNAVRATPSHYLILPDYNLSGQDLLKQVMRENPHHRWAGKGTAHTLISAHAQYKGLPLYSRATTGGGQTQQQQASRPSFSSGQQQHQTGPTPINPQVVSDDEFERIQQQKAEQEAVRQQQMTSVGGHERPDLSGGKVLIQHGISSTSQYVDPSTVGAAPLQATRAARIQRTMNTFTPYDILTGRTSFGFQRGIPTPTIGGSAPTIEPVPHIEIPPVHGPVVPTVTPLSDPTGVTPPTEERKNLYAKKIQDNAHRIANKEQPWGINHPAVTRIAKALGGLGIGIHIAEGNKEKREVIITTADGATTIKLTLSGQRRSTPQSWSREGHVYFETVNPQYVQRYIHLIPHLFLPGAEKPERTSPKLPIYWKNDFANLVGHVASYAPEHLNELKHILLSLPKNNRLTGTLARRQKKDNKGKAGVHAIRNSVGKIITYQRPGETLEDARRRAAAGKANRTAGHIRDLVNKQRRG